MTKKRIVSAETIAKRAATRAANKLNTSPIAVKDAIFYLDKALALMELPPVSGFRAKARAKDIRLFTEIAKRTLEGGMQ